MQISPVDFSPMISEAGKTALGKTTDPKEEFLVMFLKQIMASPKSVLLEDEEGLFTQQNKEMANDLASEAMIRQLINDRSNGLYDKFYSKDQ
ncbi:MAG: hypothetical protein WC838_05805 [Candidatus Margulisiibacteriota bacterium]